MTLEAKMEALYYVVEDIIAEYYEDIQAADYYNNQVYLHFTRVAEWLVDDTYDEEWFGSFLDEQRKWLRQARKDHANAAWFDDYEGALNSIPYL